jgi:hypothetical protein
MTGMGRLAAGLPILFLSLPAARTVTWNDLKPAVQARLDKWSGGPSSFDARIAGLARDGERRVRDGDMDHLVFYLLQSTHFTRQPPLEPALSAREFVEAAKSSPSRGVQVPPSVRPRMTALLRALDSTDRDARLQYFRALLAGAVPDRETVIAAEYARAMNFLYAQEFVTRRGASGDEQVARLYESRGLSTDTAIEAGYAVHVGLAILKSLDPSRRIRRVLIVGPGMDIAPRTGMLETGPPESYQPWAVIDALVGLGLSTLDDLTVVGGDINPRVVDHLNAAGSAPPVLRLVSGLGDSGTLRLSSDYRAYFEGLGRALGPAGPIPKAPAGHLAKTVRVDGRAARVVRAERLDVVTQRLDGDPFDLVITTNVLPYFNEVELLLALSNISAMLKADGILLHNERRMGLPEDAAAAGLPLEQSRQVVIASVSGAPPLADSVWIHRRQRMATER